MPRAIVLNRQDNVATLIDAGSAKAAVDLTGEGKGKVTLAADVPYGHKCAIQAIAKGANIVKYGEIIGRATADIPVGAHVHVHNVEALRGRGDVKGKA